VLRRCAHPANEREAAARIAECARDPSPALTRLPFLRALLCTQVHASAGAVAEAAVRLFVDVTSAAVARKGAAVVALSGGSLPSQLSALASARVDWSKLHVFLADERCVPLSSPDSNLRALKAAFLDAVPIPPANVHGISGAATPDAEADAYEAAINALPAAALPRTAAGVPVFDLILLGVGPDGHTASLFPNRAGIAVTGRSVLAVTDSPKPPAARITLLLPVLNAAATVAFVAAGAAKAEVVQRVLECQALPGSLPAQLVRPAPPGELRWLLDAPAAAQLRTADWAKPAKWPRSEVPAPPKAE
jgi:6-phosphogluconolactonase